MAILSTIAGVLSLVGAGVGIFDALFGDDDEITPSVQPEQLEALRSLTEISQRTFNEIAIPNNLADQATRQRTRDLSDSAAQGLQSPIYKALVDDYSKLLEGRDRRNVANSARQLGIENARAQARGGPGFFRDPERRDESMARAIMAEFGDARENANVNALEQARAQIAQAANTNIGAQGGFFDTGTGAGSVAQTGFSNVAGQQTTQNLLNQGQRAAGLDAAFNQLPRALNNFVGTQSNSIGTTASVSPNIFNGLQFNNPSLG